MQPDTEQVILIDKINIPKDSIVEYTEKSLYIRKTLKQQPGFVKFESYQHKHNNGNLQVITVVTWKNQKAMEDAKLNILEALQKTGINMSKFLEEQGITMEKGIYQAVME